MSINDQYNRGRAWLPMAWRKPQSYIGVSADGRLYRVDDVGAYSWGERKHEDVTLYEFDTKPSGREHWRRIKLFLEWLAAALDVGVRDWARVTYKDLRRHHHSRQRKEWDQVLPKEIVSWAYGVIREAQEGEMCCDNDRVALKGNTGQMRRYHAQKKDGCCGFADFEKIGPDGKTYLIGFNYGH